MNSIIEKPINILFIGDEYVGKTSIIHRIINKVFPLKYIPTDNVLEACIVLKLWDKYRNEINDPCFIRITELSFSFFSKCSNEIKNSNYNKSISIYINQLKEIIDDVDSIVFIVDASNIKSLDVADEWLYLLKTLYPSNLIDQIPKYLIVNKADLIANVKPNLSFQLLDKFSQEYGFVKWNYTVSTPILADFNPIRSQWFHQTAPELVLLSIIRKVLSIRFGKESPIPIPNQKFESFNN